MNIGQVQVGHVPRNVALKLAPLLDRNIVTVEGVMKDGNRMSCLSSQFYLLITSCIVTRSNGYSLSLWAFDMWHRLWISLTPAQGFWRYMVPQTNAMSLNPSWSGPPPGNVASPGTIEQRARILIQAYRLVQRGQDTASILMNTLLYSRQQASRPRNERLWKHNKRLLWNNKRPLRRPQNLGEW